MKSQVISIHSRCFPLAMTRMRLRHNINQHMKIVCKLPNEQKQTSESRCMWDNIDEMSEKLTKVQELLDDCLDEECEASPEFDAEALKSREYDL